MYDVLFCCVRCDVLLFQHFLSSGIEVDGRSVSDHDVSETWCFFEFISLHFLSSGNEVAGRSVSDHDPQADHTHCVLDITRKEYMYILDGVCCGELR